jgi:hypothetical protein
MASLVGGIVERDQHARELKGQLANLEATRAALATKAKVSNSVADHHQRTPTKLPKSHRNDDYSPITFSAEATRKEKT